MARESEAGNEEESSTVRSTSRAQLMPGGSPIYKRRGARRTS